jgi:hypothetical protein
MWSLTPCGSKRTASRSLLLMVLLVLGEGRPSPAADQNPAADAMNDAPAWMVRLAVDRKDGSYVVGEDVNIEVTSERDGFLYLFDIDSSGAQSLLFPNSFQPDARIQASTAVAVPGPARFRIRVGPRGLGTETLLAVVTTRPLREIKLEVFSRTGPTTLRSDQADRLLAEAILGRTEAPEGLRAARENLRRRDPQEYALRAREWAEHSIQIHTAAARVPIPPQRVGLFVGISRYAHLPPNEQLQFAHIDAIHMEQIARQVGRFNRRILLTDSSATLDSVRSALKDIVGSTRPGDTVLIFWSGHGGRAKTGKSRRPFVYYLLPHDFDPELFHEDEFGRWVQALDGRKVMVVIDACFSGGHIEGAKTPTRDVVPDVDPRTRTTEPPHFLDSVLLRARSIGQHDAAILTACRLDQKSLETEHLQAGVLTFFVVQALAQGSGPLTLEDVYRHVDPGIRKYMRATDQEGQQTPTFSDQTPRPPAVIRP